MMLVHRRAFAGGAPRRHQALLRTIERAAFDRLESAAEQTRSARDDLRHGLGDVILCLLPAARKAKRERGYDFARIGGHELVVGIGHPRMIAEAWERH
jgi:hypothetical protein